MGIVLGQPLLDDPLNRVPAQSAQFRYIQNRHHPAQVDHVAFELSTEVLIRPDKGGETSQVWPQPLHRYRGTSAFNHTGLSPMGTIRTFLCRCP